MLRSRQRRGAVGLVDDRRRRAVDVGYVRSRALVNAGCSMSDGADDVDRLLEYVHSCSWLMGVLAAARAVDPPQWWVGGGVLRDLVWDTQAGEFDPRRVKDIST